MPGRFDATIDDLQEILAGEPPYDIFVRWKPLHQQPVGWEPDLNDGVLVNVWPFVEAGVFGPAEVHLGVRGRHQVGNALSAAAVGLALATATASCGSRPRS